MSSTKKLNRIDYSNGQINAYQSTKAGGSSVNSKLYNSYYAPTGLIKIGTRSV